MELLNLKVEQIKGIRSAEYKFIPGTNTVLGENGSGKTTLADIWHWVFTDKDYDGNSNPELHPDYMEESQPSATLTVDIDGKQVEIRKYQVDVRTKKQIEEGAPVRISNKYEINGVPKTQKDFIRYLTDAGVDMEHFRLLSHPNEYTSYKTQDGRNLLFSMVTDVTDLDVAESLGDECTETAEQLKTYRLDEVAAMAKKEYKECKNNLEVMPQQIVGMEKAKAEIDPDIPKKMADIEDEIELLSKGRDEVYKKCDTSVFNTEIKKLDQERIERYNSVNSDRLKALEASQKERDKAKYAYNDAAMEGSKLKSEGERINADFRRDKESLAALEKSKKKIEKEKFAGPEICPTCGQNIPKEQVEGAKIRWQNDRERRLSEVNEQMESTQAHIDELKAKGKELAEKKQKSDNKAVVAKKQYAEADKEVSLHSKPIRPDCSDIEEKIKAVQAEKNKIQEYTDQAIVFESKIHGLRQQYNDYVRKQAAEKVNEKIDKEIDLMKQQMKEYAQKKADAEKILYQVQLISRKKNDMLSDSINSHFTRVKFRLFDIQKNGEIKDDCTPMVLTSDGEYRDMKYSANTAAIEAAKLDICNGLQKFFDQSIPVFLDGAECFDEKNRKELKIDSQLILLCVSDDKELVFK